MTNIFSQTVLKTADGEKLTIDLSLRDGKYVLEVPGTSFKPETIADRGSALERQAEVVAEFVQLGHAVASPFFFDAHTAAVTG